MSIVSKRGFTIVELLIVIVVIGILAAITIVAYNGFQERANNGKTTQSLTAWIKALQLHKADKGQWPSGGVCLGTGYKYGLDGAATSGTAQCRQTGTYGSLESTAFNTTMQPYIGSSLPTPHFVTARSTDTEWRRGIHYLYGGGAGNVVYIDSAFQGSAPCPVIAGITPYDALWGSNKLCEYIIGYTDS